MWISDHLAQSRLVLFKDGGKNGCAEETNRTCQVGLIPHYVFNEIDCRVNEGENS